MALNYIWISFFFIAFVVSLVRLIFFGNIEVFPDMMNATFESDSRVYCHYGWVS